MFERLQQLCVEGDAAQAKAAVVVLSRLPNNESVFDTLTKVPARCSHFCCLMCFVKTLVSKLDAAQLNLSAILTALSRVAQLVPASFAAYYRPAAEFIVNKMLGACLSTPTYACSSYLRVCRRVRPVQPSPLKIKRLVLKCWCGTCCRWRRTST